MKRKTIYSALFLLMLSLGNSYSATFDYDFTNVNNRIPTNTISLFFQQPIIASYPYYYIVGQSYSYFYLSQYNYVTGEETWVKTWGPTNSGSGLSSAAISTDNSHNSHIFVCGNIKTNYEGQINNGTNNIYVARINVSNKITEWSRIFGSTGNDCAPKIKLDSHTNIFIYGMTDGSIGTNINKCGVGPDALDIFLTKYDYDGNYQWTRMWGSTNHDDNTDIAIDRSNNVYLLGYTHGDIGAATNNGLCDMFLIKTDTDGITQWTKMIGGSSNDAAEALAIDSSNNIVIYGCTEGDLNDQPHTGKVINIAILKFNSNGSNIWTKLLGSTNYDYQFDGGKMALDQDNIYITSTIISNTAKNVTLIKFADNGNNIWTKTWTTGTNYETFAMSRDGSGSLFILSRQSLYLFGRYEIRTLFPKYDLVINSSTNQHGTNSLPFTYGTNRVVGGIFTNSITDEYPSTGTRYLCTGWNGSGSISTSGTTNTVAFFLTNNSTLTWNWQKQYYVSISNTAGCRVSYISGTNEWNNEGANIVMSAYPQIYFQNWNIQPISATPTNNPLYLLNLTQPLSVTAYFGYEDNGYGIASEWVASYYGISYNPTTNSDCNGDGLTDYECYLAGINPTNGNIFAITSISLSNGFPVISWKNDYTEYERYFTIMAKDDLMSTNWFILGSVFASGNGSYTYTNAHSHAFYKVVVGIK